MICLFLVRRFAKPLRFGEMVDYGNIFANAIGVVFALILAFVAVSVWQNYDKVDDGVEKEANALHSIYSNLGAYPEPYSTVTRDKIRQYITQVTGVEWPKLSDAKEDETARRMITEISTEIYSFNPQNSKHLVLHAETTRRMSEYMGLRHDRLLGAKPNLTSPMWITLIGGTLLFLIYLCFFSVPSYLHHAFMISFLAAFIGLVFCLLILYNYPFTEPAAVGHEPLDNLLEFWKSDLKVKWR